jgi:small subunit ribosomal protein S16
VAVKLRLMRMGKKKQPTYRVVAADSRKARNGRFIEALGFYDPRREPSVIEIDNERAVAWLRNGAQPTERVEKLLKISGAWTDFSGEQFDATPPAPAPAAEKAVVEEAADEAVVEEAADEAVVEEAADEAVVEEAADEAVVEEAADEAVVEEVAGEPAVGEASVDEADEADEEEQA